MEIKNIVTISLMIFIIIIVGILGASVFLKQNNTQTTATANINTAAAGITMAQLATHNSATDCWLIVNSKVYNVSNYINLHPAGPETIIPYCGKDATTAFDTRNGRGPHPQRAQNTLNNYYVGDITR